MWHPCSRWFSCPLDLKICSHLLVLWISKFIAFHTFLENHKHTFSCSRTQLVLLDMVIIWTTKYLKWVIACATFPDHTFKGVSPPIADEGNLLMRWQVYANALAQKDFNNPALDKMQWTFSNRVMFILLVILFCCNVSLFVKCLSMPHRGITVWKDH